ncbi:MAG: hypothetical protein J6C46_01400 [Clostridia bacterium]|nr:hypothetical protein [Clostridia bacterium]
MGEFNGEIRLLGELKGKLLCLVKKYNELAIKSKQEFCKRCKENWTYTDDAVELIFAQEQDEHEKWFKKVETELDAISITGKGDLVYYVSTYEHREEIISFVMLHLRRLEELFGEKCSGMLLASHEYEAYKNFLTKEYMIYTNK